MFIRLLLCLLRDPFIIIQPYQGISNAQQPCTDPPCPSAPRDFTCRSYLALLPHWHNQLEFLEEFLPPHPFVQATPASSLLWVRSYGCHFFCFSSLEYIWICFCFFFFYSFCMFKNYCNTTENLSPKSVSQYKSELSKGRLLARSNISPLFSPQSLVFRLLALFTSSWLPRTHLGSSYFFLLSLTLAIIANWKLSTTWLSRQAVRKPRLHHIISLASAYNAEAAHQRYP